MWRVIYWESPRTPEGGQAGKGDKPPPLHILHSRGAHTQLLLATFKGGIVATEKGNVETGKVSRTFQKNEGVVMFSSVCQLSKMNFLPSSAKKTFLKTSCASCLKRLTSG